MTSGSSQGEPRTSRMVARKVAGPWTVHSKTTVSAPVALASTSSVPPPFLAATASFPPASGRLLETVIWTVEPFKATKSSAPAKKTLGPRRL